MNVVIWSKYDCTFCEQAKELLRQKEIGFEEKKIGDGYTKEELLEAVPGARSVPQIFIDGTLVGGFDKLKEWMTNVNR